MVPTLRARPPPRDLVSGGAAVPDPDQDGVLEDRGGHLEKHGERVSDHRKVPETLFKARKCIQNTIKYTGTTKTDTAGGSPICIPVLLK